MSKIMPETTARERHAFAREVVLLARRWKIVLTDRLRALGLTPVDWSILYWLWQSPDGLRQAALAEVAGVEPTTLVRTLDRLEAQQLVERRVQAGDRRANLIFLTEAAMPTVLKIDAIAGELRNELLGHIGRDELRSSLVMIQELRTRLDGL